MKGLDPADCWSHSVVLLPLWMAQGSPGIWSGNCTVLRLDVGTCPMCAQEEDVRVWTDSAVPTDTMDDGGGMIPNSIVS